MKEVEERRRRISLWHGQGVPAKELAERAGHARASMSLDRYAHVMLLEEAGEGALHGTPWVWSPCGPAPADQAKDPANAEA